MYGSRRSSNSAVYDGNLTTFDSKRLEKAQNRAARLITGTIRRTPVDSLRKELGWSSVSDRRQIHRLLLFHKLLYDPTIPEFIKAMVPKTRATVASRPLRNTNNNLISSYTKYNVIKCNHIRKSS